MTKTYLSSKLVTYEKAILNFDDTYHIAVLHFFLDLHLGLRCLVIVDFVKLLSLHLLLLCLVILLRVLPGVLGGGVVGWWCTRLVELKAAEFMSCTRVLIKMALTTWLSKACLSHARSQLLLLHVSVYLLCWGCCGWNLHLMAHVYVRVRILIV